MNELKELIRGFSLEDEFIARDMLVLELLLEKGLVTKEDIDEIFTEENYTKYIEIVKEQRRKTFENK